MILMKTRKPSVHRQTKTKTSHLKTTFTIYRKYRNHKHFVHPDLL